MTMDECDGWWRRRRRKVDAGCGGGGGLESPPYSSSSSSYSSSSVANAMAGNDGGFRSTTMTSARPMRHRRRMRRNFDDDSGSSCANGTRTSMPRYNSTRTMQSPSLAGMVVLLLLMATFASPLLAFRPSHPLMPMTTVARDSSEVSLACT